MSSKHPISLYVQIAVLVTAFVALVGVALWRIPLAANDAAVTANRVTVAEAVEGEQRRLESLAFDNAVWSAAADAFYTQFDQGFMDETWAGEIGVYDRFIVIDGKGRPVLGFDDGVAMAPATVAELARGLDRFIAAADSKGDTFSSAVRIDDQLYYAATARIIFEDRPPASAYPDGSPHRMVLLQRFDAKDAAALGRSLRLEGFGFGSGRTEGASIAMTGPEGEILATLGWTVVEPGRAAFWSAFPYFFALAIMHLLFALLVAHRGLRHLAQLHRDTLVDSLTELPNRRSFRADFTARLGTGAPAVIGLLDLDGFKAVNDELGHEVGDAILVDIARMLAKLCGERCFVARLGGDEFALLASGDDARARMETVCSEILQRFRRPFEVGENSVTLGVSIGLTRSGIGNQSVVELMRRADLAMYGAKRAGKMQMRWFDSALDLKAVTRRSNRAA